MMNWVRIEDFNPIKKNSVSDYIVICHDEERAFFGVEKAELINGSLTVDSVVMNNYGQGGFISHFIELTLPNFIKKKSVISIDFEILRQYDLDLLLLDEILFFEWIISLNLKKFYYSDKEITSKLGIKRRRLEVIKNKFATYGLVIEKKGKNNTTHYEVFDEFITNFYSKYLKVNN